MATINQIDQVCKTNVINGSNFPDGLTYGDFSSLNKRGRGIPAGLIYPSKIEMVPTSTLVSQDLNTTGNTYLLLDNPVFPYTSLVHLANNETGLQLDYPRALAIESTDTGITGTIKFSGYDRYYNKICFQRNVDAASLGARNVMFSGIFIITNILFTPTSVIAPDTTFRIKTSAYAELPFTDYSWKGNLVSQTIPTASSSSIPIQAVSLTGDAGAEVYYYYWYNEYIQASWDENVTLEFGRPRPLINLSGATSTPYLFQAVTMYVLQTLYGFESTREQMRMFSYTNNSQAIENYLLSSESIYGRANNIIGWEGWVG